MPDLIHVPPEVSQVATAALATRDARNGGGTARGVTIATALATGVISTAELVELQDWHARNPDQVRDDLSTLLAGLYGGAPARAAWPPGSTVTAALSPREQLAARLAKLSQRVNATDRTLLAKLHGAAIVALEEAVTQADLFVTGRTRTAFTRSKPNEARIAAVMEETGKRGTLRNVIVEALALNPVVLAALGLDEQDILDRRFATFAATATALISAAELRKIRAAATALGEDPDALQARYAETIQTRADAATALLVASLGLLARQALSGSVVTPAQGELSGPVPFGVVRNAFLVASRGASAPLPVETGPGSATAELVTGRLAQIGSSLVDDLLAEAQGETGPVVKSYVWTHGDPTRPFEPHEALDGVEYDDETRADVLAADPGEFPYVDQYAEGDHDGCSCFEEEILSPAESPEMVSTPA